MDSVCQPRVLFLPLTGFLLQCSLGPFSGGGVCLSTLRKPWCMRELQSSLLTAYFKCCVLFAATSPGKIQHVLLTHFLHWFLPKSFHGIIIFNWIQKDKEWSSWRGCIWLLQYPPSCIRTVSLVFVSWGKMWTVVRGRNNDEGKLLFKSTL